MLAKVIFYYSNALGYTMETYNTVYILNGICHNYSMTFSNVTVIVSFHRKCDLRTHTQKWFRL